MARILRAEWQGLATGMDGVFAGVDGYQVIRFITGWTAGATPVLAAIVAFR
tara:strand:- start:181 stop:333 length:153 start_codon:yes stop_codon:yes gene_type:complete